MEKRTVADDSLTVRASDINDFEKVIDYFLKSDKEFLTNMGVDISKLPSKAEWLRILTADFSLDPESRKFFYVIWLSGNRAIGHSNINKIIFGEEAYMHLHLWEANKRRKGIGFRLLKDTLPLYFNTYQLKNLYCEPSASNPAPNNTLKKLGFEFIKSYNTIPGWINSFQTVNKWCLTDKKFKLIYRAGS
jgi:RimJ/RimL family protein N-acetyltransferase